MAPGAAVEPYAVAVTPAAMSTAARPIVVSIRFRP
jgi:hypothetical protein